MWILCIKDQKVIEDVKGVNMQIGNTIQSNVSNVTLMSNVLKVLKWCLWLLSKCIQGVIGQDQTLNLVRLANEKMRPLVSWLVNDQKY